MLVGADVNAIDRFGLTPLHNSVRSGNDDNSALLLESGADPNACILPIQRNSSRFATIGRTPLHRARSQGSVRLLLEYGAYPFAFMQSTAEDNPKRQSVIKHLLERHPQACMELLDHGISTNGQLLDSDKLLVVFDYEMFYQEGLLDINSISSSKVKQPPATKRLESKTCDEMAVHRAILKYSTN